MSLIQVDNLSFLDNAVYDLIVTSQLIHKVLPTVEIGREGEGEGEGEREGGREGLRERVRKCVCVVEREGEREA